MDAVRPPARGSGACPPTSHKVDVDAGVAARVLAWARRSSWRPGPPAPVTAGGAWARGAPAGLRGLREGPSAPTWIVRDSPSPSPLIRSGAQRILVDAAAILSAAVDAADSSRCWAWRYFRPARENRRERRGIGGSCFDRARRSDRPARTVDAFAGRTHARRFRRGAGPGGDARLRHRARDRRAVATDLDPLGRLAGEKASRRAAGLVLAPGRDFIAPPAAVRPSNAGSRRSFVLGVVLHGRSGARSSSFQTPSGGRGPTPRQVIPPTSKPRLGRRSRSGWSPCRAEAAGRGRRVRGAGRKSSPGLGAGATRGGRGARPNLTHGLVEVGVFLKWHAASIKTTPQSPASDMGKRPGRPKLGHRGRLRPRTGPARPGAPRGVAGGARRVGFDDGLSDSASTIS